MDDDKFIYIFLAGIFVVILAFLGTEIYRTYSKNMCITQAPTVEHALICRIKY